MPSNVNRFERISDMAAGVITRQIEATDKALGVDGRPFDAVPLKPEEVAPYFASLSPKQQAQQWPDLSDKEKALFKQHLGG